MSRHFFVLLFFLCASLTGGPLESEIFHLRVNLFCEPRAGLARDQMILKQTLESFGCSVNCLSSKKDVPFADINIFCETLRPQGFAAAAVNWFIPNPEWFGWYGQEEHLLDEIDLILCRTHEVERIFSELRKETFYLGFSSPDHYDPKYTKDYTSCLHLAGTSWQKGTEAILRAWAPHPEFPHLSIVRFPSEKPSVPANVAWLNHWLPEVELHALQNECGIHLCLSETEGFGHYLMEGMAVGAVVIATDAPPMNEFIKDSRCLVPYTAWRRQMLATNYYVNAPEIEEKIEEILKLPRKELEAIGRENRKNYLKRHEKFLKNFGKLLSKHVH